MKKYFSLVFALLIFTSCEKDPDLDKVQDQVVTYTQYDTGANFSAAKTFYVPDSLLIINSNEKATYYTDASSTQIINTLVDEMTSRGYTQVEEKDAADLGIQMSYVESTHYFAVSDPYWWNGYPGYWWPGYWGGYWSNWYYPYVNIFSYTNGSLLTDMINLNATSTDKKLPVIWQAYTVGLLQGTDQQNLSNAIQGVKQAFKQSSYIKSSDTI